MPMSYFLGIFLCEIPVLGCRLGTAIEMLFES